MSTRFEQPGLFAEEPLPRHCVTTRRRPIAAAADPSTSHQAAAELDASGARDRQVELVAGALRRFPGSTSRELAEAAGLDRYVVARRLPDAEDASLARRGPARVCRISGRMAIIWNPAPEAER